MDVKLSQDPRTKEFDISFDGDEFALDPGLQTMTAISLFSDAREDSRADDPRGWWGASVLQEDRSGGPFGSKLWLLAREKQVPETLLKIKEWCQTALQWMVDSGLAKGISVQAIFLALGVVKIVVSIAQDSGSQTFAYLWEGQRAV